jgi:hypothetical protein
MTSAGFCINSIGFSIMTLSDWAGAQALKARTNAIATKAMIVRVCNDSSSKLV